MNVAETLESCGISKAFMTESVVKNISDYLDSHGISNAFVADKIGMLPQVFGQKMLGKVRLNIDEYLSICEVLEKDQSFFIENGGD